MNNGGFKMKKKLVVGLALAMSLNAMPIVANAEGSATINFKSNDQVNVGENIKVYLSIEDIVNKNNGIVSIGGELVYDNEKLELVNAKKLDTPYYFTFNPASNMLAGLDFSFENELNKDTKLYEFTFKAIEEGNTYITVNEAELGDKKAELLTPNVYGKTINITEKEEKKVEKVKPVLTSKKEIKVIKTTVKTEKKETVETNKAKLQKINHKVCNLIKKISKLF